KIGELVVEVMKGNQIVSAFCLSNVELTQWYHIFNLTLLRYKKTARRRLIQSSFVIASCFAQRQESLPSSCRQLSSSSTPDCY
ncbi:hypothetical protein, partial [Vibrio diabolicus]|uniref:hypothetical protein n=1 Tax=Vibrio diabolicus TaxID=50719 RepID=UPI001C71202D